MPECPDQNDLSLRVTPPIVNPGPEYAADRRLFQGIPGIEVVAPGHLWTTFYTGGDTECELNYVTLGRSLDGGRTWQEPVLVIDPPSRVRAYDPTLWLDPVGRLWVFWSQVWYKKGIWDGRAGVWGMYTTEPTADEPTWSEPCRIADGVMMNKPAVDEQGTWFMPVSIWNLEPFLPETEGRRGAGCVISTDNGATFAFTGSTIMPECIFDEHHITPMGDGSLWMTSRTRNGIGESVSTDGGYTWSEAKVRDLHCPNSRFYIRRLASGNLVLVNHVADPARSTANGWGGRFNLTAFLSDDNGKSWKGGLLLDERHAVSYPDGCQAADGTIYITYDLNRRTDREILFACFREEDILAGQPISDACGLRQLISKGTGVVQTD